MADELKPQVDSQWSKVGDLPKLNRTHNPYDPPFHTWPPEVLEAYKTFPKISGTNAPINDQTWPQWRQWAKDYADRRELWPGKLKDYIAERKRQEDKKKSSQGQ